MAHSVVTPLAAAGMAASMALGFGLDSNWAGGAAALVQEAGDPAQNDGQTIVVTGERLGQNAVDRIATAPVDTPQTISTLTKAELERRGISNLNEALRNVAGLSLGAGETSFQGNNAILRGFTTRNDLFLDNARDYGYYFRDTFNDEQIDVLKGPSSILFGRGSTGGIIHRSSKQPQAKAFLRGEAQLGLSDLRRLSLDANLPGALGAHSRLRVSAVAHHNGVAGRDSGYSERWGVAPILAFGADGPTRASLSYVHQEENNRPDYGVPWIAGTRAAPGFPAPVSQSNYYGFANDHLTTRVNIATARLSHDFSSQVNWRAQLRYSNDTRSFRYSEAVLPAGVTGATRLATVQVARNLFEGASRDTFLQAQSEVQADVALAGSRHVIIAGVEGGSEASDPVYYTNSNVPGTSLVAPSGGFYESPANRLVRLRGRSRSRFIGLFAIDTIEFGNRWRAILGVRWDSFQTRYASQRFAPGGAVDRDTTADRTDRKASYRAAIIYKPAPAGSLYASYATSFNPSGEGVESLVSAGRSVAQSNLNLAPETSSSAELGAKWELFGRRALLTAALFRIEKNNVRVPDPLLPGFNTLGGRQRVDGFEAELSGEPRPGWNVRANYSLLESQTLQSTPAGPIVGAPLVLTPRHSASFSSSYDITPRFEAGVNLVVASSRLGQNSAALYLVAPGYAVLDMDMAWRLSGAVKIRLIINNIANRRYYDQLHPFHVVPGAGRSAQLSVAADF